MSQPDQPHILVLPSGDLAAEIITPRAWAVLESLGTVERNPLGRMPTADELAAWLPRATAVMTSWGTPPFDAAMLAAAPQLRIIGHAAGSIRRLTPAAGLRARHRRDARRGRDRGIGRGMGTHDDAHGAADRTHF